MDDNNMNSYIPLLTGTGIKIYGNLTRSLGMSWLVYYR